MNGARKLSRYRVIVGGHWRSVAVQTVTEAGIYHGAGFIKRVGAGVRVQDSAGFL
jgi:hypothetical protein